MFSFCMYCCTERCAAITISIFSAFFILTSGATIYFMDRMRDQSYVWHLQADPLVESNAETDYHEPNIEIIKQVLFWGIIGLCALSIIVGFLGFATARYKTCCTISLYSFFTLILTLIFLGVGALLMTVTVASHMQVNEYCAQSNNTTYSRFTVNLARYFLTYVDEYEKATQLPQTYMCSTLCPCDGAVINQTLYTKGFGREESLVIIGGPNGKYSEFKECYDDLVKDKKLEIKVQEPMLNLLKYLEDNYQCSGLCTAPSFNFFRSISAGPPQDTCMKPLQTIYRNTLGLLSLGLLVTGFCYFLAFNAQYGLWRRRFTASQKNKQKQSQEGGGETEVPSLGKGTKKDREMNYLVE